MTDNTNVNTDQSAKPAKAKWSTRKKILIFGGGALVLLLIIIAAASGGAKKDAPASAPSAITAETPAAEAPEAVEAAPVGVTIEGAKFSTDYAGNKVIVIDYTFTNLEDKATSFMLTYKAQAFQGGVELDDIAIGVDEVDTSTLMADLKPGATLTLSKAYTLRDASTVTVEVTKLFSFNDDILATKDFAGE